MQINEDLLENVITIGEKANDNGVQFKTSRNVLDMGGFKGRSGVNGGVTWSIDENGIFTLNGTCTSSFAIGSIQPYITVNNYVYQMIFLSGTASGGDFTFVTNVGGGIKYLTNNARWIVINGEITNIQVYVNQGVTFSDAKIGICLTKSGIPYFEPYMVPSIKVYDEEIYNKNSLNDAINQLSKVYQPKITNDMTAWQGNKNYITIPQTYYGYYLIITMTPFGDSSVYLLSVINSTLNSIKISGNTDTSFSISNRLLTLTLSKNGYWNSFALYLGTVK